MAGSDHNQGNETYFGIDGDALRNERRRWPYTFTALEETLDTDLIEAKGRQILYRGLSAGNVTAFVGSGVPMAYGRLSWRGWEDLQLGDIEMHAKRFVSCAQAMREWLQSYLNFVTAVKRAVLKARPPTPDLESDESRKVRQTLSLLAARIAALSARGGSLVARLDQIEDLLTTFMHLRSGGSGIGGELPPIRFQVAKQLHDLLRKSWPLLAIDRQNEQFQFLWGVLERFATAQADEFDGHRVHPHPYTAMESERLHVAEIIFILFAKKYGSKNKIKNKIKICKNAILDEINGIDSLALNLNEKAQKYAERLEEYSQVAARPIAREPFERMAKMLLVDEVAHAEESLLDGITYGYRHGREEFHVTPRRNEETNRKREVRRKIYRQLYDRRRAFDREQLNREMSSIRDGRGLKRYAVLGHFKSKALRKLLTDQAFNELFRESKFNGRSDAADLPGPVTPTHRLWSDVADMVFTENSENLKAVPPRAFISPVHRYVVGMLLALLPDPLLDLTADPRTDTSPEGAEGDNDSRWSPFLFHKRVEAADYVSRFSMNDEPLDPLWKLSVDLRIRRFLTTNYDFEIERLFEDRAYNDFGKQHYPEREEVEPDQMRQDGLGGRIIDRVFTRSEAADLTAFSVGLDEADAGVFHLHGRATAKSRLVITERDYMDLYLKEDENRETVNESIRTAFSASPLFFVGLGLGEADVMRPLRQFMSNRAPAHARRAVALLHATEDKAGRAKGAATVYLRYGVHVIYCGDATVTIRHKKKNADRGEGSEEIERVYQLPNFDWLHRTMKLTDELLRRTERRLSALQDVMAKHRNFAKSPDSEKNEAENGLEHSVAALLDVDEETATSETGGKSATPLQLFPRDEANRKRSIAALDHHLGTFDITDPDFPPFADLAKKDRTCSALAILFGRLAQKFSYDFIKTTPIAMLSDISLDGELKDLLSIIHVPSSESAKNILPFERKMLARLLQAEGEGFQYAFLNDRAPTAEELAKEPVWDDFHHAIRDQLARKIALDGIKNALFTGTMTASLDRIRTDWIRWHNSWLLSPPHRIPRLHRLSRLDKEENPKGDRLPVRLVRHRLAITITDFDRKHERNEAHPTDVRAFDTFIAALKNRSEQDLREMRLKPGRRVHLVAARRGIGKGTFISAFTSRAGLGAYIEQSWPCEASQRPEYVAAVFINLSFSTEIASCFDSIIGALTDHLASIKYVHSIEMPFSIGNCIDRIRTIFEEFYIRRGMPLVAPSKWNTQKEEILLDVENELKKLPRLAKLSHLVNEISVAARRFQDPARPLALPRFILAINAAELFFHAPGATGAGFAKSREIYEFLDMFVSPAVAPTPIDLVLIANDTYLGAPLVRPVGTGPNDRTLVWVSAIRDNISAAGLREVRRLEADSPLMIATDTDRPDALDSDRHLARQPDGRVLPSTEYMGAVHIAQPMSSWKFLVENFLIAAMLLYLRYQVRRGSRGKAVKEKLERDVACAWQVKREARQKDPYGLSKKSEKELGELRAKDVNVELRTALMQCILGREVAIVTTDEREALRREVESILHHRYQSDPIAQRDWEQFRHSLRSSRFCLTVILAAAERRALETNDPLTAADEINNFLGSIADAVLTAGINERERVVLSRVLDGYERTHRKCAPANDMELHHLILRHIAVIGIPVGVDVLVRAPAIRAYFDRQGNVPTRRRSEDLAEALASLKLRGLVFQIRSNPRLRELQEGLAELRRQQSSTPAEAAEDPDQPGMEAEHPVSLEKRYKDLEKRLLNSPSMTDQEELGRRPSIENNYALHRIVQIYILRKMGTEAREFGELNTFAPTLYASMPAELPRPSYEAYEFLRKLVASFSQYPDTPLDEGETQEWVFEGAPMATRVEALRAALSILRSTFSIAVVSRFSDYVRKPDRRDVQNPRGFFEVQLIQLRWIIRNAGELLATKRPKGEEIKAAEYNPDDPVGHWQINACYRDEIVWLYNECGIVCLVQGNLNEAVNYFRQAISLNRSIEHGDGAPIHNMISLNLAVTQLERGSAKSARKRLVDIVNSESEAGHADGRICNLADGYLGLVYHIRGDRALAAAHYVRAIESLRRFGDRRSLAIFCFHHANLSASAGEVGSARKLMAAALDHAAAGGHEDLRHWVLMAEIKFERAHGREGKSPTGDKSNYFHRLDRIKQYAETMEMPSLLVDALTERARILLSQGETSLSGSLLVQAMSLAKSNGMGLRLNAAMLVYAKLLYERGRTRSARIFLDQAIHLAKRFGNQTVIDGAERHSEKRPPEFTGYEGGEATGNRAFW